MTPGPGGNPLRFRPRWWGLVLAASGCGAGVMLGNWQAGRAEEKRSAAAQVQRIALRGEFLPQFTVFIGNRLHRGQPGYQVVQPLRTADAKHVLVNRGWIASAPGGGNLPELVTPAGDVALEGIRLEHFARAYEPAGSRHEGRVWQNVSIEEFARWSGLLLEPYALEQHSALLDGLARDWPAAGAGVEMHEMYSLQWYSLAALSVVLFLVLSVRRDRSPS